MKDVVKPVQIHVRLWDRHPAHRLGAIGLFLQALLHFVQKRRFRFRMGPDLPEGHLIYSRRPGGLGVTLAGAPSLPDDLSGGSTLLRAHPTPGFRPHDGIWFPMVVVAIIAILAGMLLPGLARARERSKRVACLSNLKGQALSFTMYADDFRGTYPTADQETAWKLDALYVMSSNQAVVLMNYGLNGGRIRSSEADFNADILPTRRRTTTNPSATATRNGSERSGSCAPRQGTNTLVLCGPLVGPGDWAWVEN